jgi:phosphate starvation-inducible PhoH-like protein
MTAPITPTDAVGDTSAASGVGPGGVVSTTRVVPSSQAMVALLGTGDEHLRRLERAVPEVDIHVRSNQLRLSGPAASVALVDRVVTELLTVVETGQQLTGGAVDQVVEVARSSLDDSAPARVVTSSILSNRGRTIRPKTVNQRQYVDAIDDNTVVFGLGPAGTGKTYLAVAKAVQALHAKAVTRIILTRPAVEAGERLGFLPGTLSEKIDPYLRPLYDALRDMLDPDLIPRLMAQGTIEVAPLAYMRGRTLSDAFIILDEAQNTSPEQMKMFLTRLGFGSTMVVTGDTTQVDLPAGTSSGLRVVEGILQGIDGIAFCRLTSSDVVRHRLVGEIVDAYARDDAARSARDRAPGPRGPTAAGGGSAQDAAGGGSAEDAAGGGSSQ